MGLAAGAVAMTLGPGRGSAQLGGPLDLVFDVGPGPNSTLAAACLNAQVTLGESMVPAGKTRLTPLAELGPTGMLQVRLQGPVVQEPVVKVVLSGGCVNKVTRQYTFLTEFPQAASASAESLPGTAATVASSAAAVKETAPTEPTPAGPSPSTQAARPVVATLAAKPVVQPSPQSVVNVVPVVKTAPPQAPVSRLQMDVLDTRPAATSGLRFSWLLASEPSEQPSPRRAEAAALWRQLNQGSQELQQAFDRAGALEAETQQLRTQAQQAIAQAQQAQAQLEARQREHYPAEWVYGLAGTSITFFGIAVWGWRRSRKVPVAMEPTWHQTPVGEGLAGGVVVASPPPAAVPVIRSVPPGSTPAPWPLKPVDTAVREPHPQAVSSPEGAPQKALQVPAPHRSEEKAPVPPTPSLTAGVVLPDDGDLSDLREQAEFFASVGEHEQAIQLFKAHIAARPHHSPVAYLELLQLYHTLGRAQDFRQLSSEWMRHFNVQVPDFSSFDGPSKDLEAYPAILGQIELAWSTGAALPLLTSLIYRDTDLTVDGDRYPLAAFDDLYLLLGIAQRTPVEKRAGGSATPGTTALEAGPAANLRTPLAETVGLVGTHAPVAIDFSLEPRPVMAPSGPETVAISPKWRAPVRPSPAPGPAAADSFPIEPVLLPPDEFLKMEMPFASPPRQAPEPSRPSALSERLRMGGDIDFDGPLLGDVLSPPIPVPAEDEGARNVSQFRAEPELTLDEGMPLAKEEDLGGYRFVGKARDYGSEKS